jgi:hypothetical protein
VLACLSTSASHFKKKLILLFPKFQQAYQIQDAIWGKIREIPIERLEHIFQFGNHWHGK